MRNYAELLRAARAMRESRETELADIEGDDRELKLLNLIVRTALQLAAVEFAKPVAPQRTSMPPPNPRPVALSPPYTGPDTAPGPWLTNIATYADFRNVGWCDGELIEHGYMGALPPDGFKMLADASDIGPKCDVCAYYVASDLKKHWSPPWNPDGRILALKMYSQTIALAVRVKT